VHPATRPRPNSEIALSLRVAFWSDELGERTKKGGKLPEWRPLALSNP
jgi:hypothetical protein